MWEPDLLVLATLTGLSFGYIVYRIGSTTARLAVLLVMLYIFQTFALQVYRVVDGTGTIDELLVVSELRVTFTIAAVAMLALLNRRAW